MIGYDTPEFWNVVRGEWASVDKHNSMFTWVGEPKITPIATSVEWSGQGCWSCSCLDIDPASIPANWRESLRRRPRTWREAVPWPAVDTLVWCLGKWRERWFLRYASDKQGYAWNDGATSLTAEKGGKSAWQFILLADTDDPNTPPPLDYVPGATAEAKPQTWFVRSSQRDVYTGAVTMLLDPGCPAKIGDRIAIVKGGA